MRRLLVLCVLFAPAAFADDAENPFAAIEIAPGIYALGNHNEGFAYIDSGDFLGGGAGLFVGEDYVILIDDVLQSTAPALLAKVKEVAGRPADFVINTHHHGDHVGGNSLAAQDGAVILSHEKLRERLAANERFNTGPESLPVLTFADAVTIHANGEEIHVFHTPHAHTDGDAIIHFRNANVIATGDLSFRGMFPFIDLDGGGSVAGYKAGMQTMIDMADEKTRFITGHGAVGTREGLQQDLQMIVDAEAAVAALIAEGLDEAAILERNPLARWHDDYSWFFITTEIFTKTLIRSLTTD